MPNACKKLFQDRGASVEQTNEWYNNPSPLLDNRVPADVWGEDPDAVMAAADTYLTSIGFPPQSP